MSTNAFVASQLVAKGFQEIILEATFVSSLWNSSHLHVLVQRARCIFIAFFQEQVLSHSPPKMGET